MNDHNNCLFCGEALDIFQHGNKEYCNDECYRQAKLQRNKEKYYHTKMRLEAFDKADAILAKFHDLYGSDKFIPALLLDDAGLDWAIAKGDAVIEQLPVKVLGIYAYCLFENKTVKIWKHTMKE